MINVNHYLQNLQANLQRGSERSHYPSLKAFIEGGIIGLNAVIEEKGNKIGIPDFTVRKNGKLVGYIEAKEMDKDLDSQEKSEQLKRYRESSIGQNFILTNYLEFRWYLDGKPKQKAILATLDNGQVIAVKNPQATVALLQSFLSYRGKDINNYYELAQQMAYQTKTIRNVIWEALEQEQGQGELKQIKLAFQELLLPDLDDFKFSDMYAQTIAYGLFTARIGQAQHPGALAFGLESAGQLISHKIPFLRGLFDTFLGTKAVKVLDWPIDELVKLLSAIDIHSILEKFGQETRKQDPVVHFYETFLAAYEASLRKSRGVYYTPEPVVTFIVEAINRILDRDFGLPFGFGHREVTILDPATGTGTFLYEVIKQVYRNFEKYGTNNWNPLLRDTKLIERLFGFELLMTPYAIAHLKLGLLLENLFGYQFQEHERLNIYLTNALEEGVKQSELIVAEFIAEEAMKATEIKSQPIIVVLGNPPYSVSSQNASKRQRQLNQDSQYLADIVYDGSVEQGVSNWKEIYKQGKAGMMIMELTAIGRLLDLYKRQVRFEGEKNIQPLDDDYIKFIRFAHHQIESTGFGVIGFVTNHSYLNGLIHRGMREELLKYFDTLYIMDLHGNSLLKETTPEREVDQNVFDIQQGVAILIAVREKSVPGYFSEVYKDRSGGKEMAKVLYYDLWGKRQEKYQFLQENSIDTVPWTKLKPTAPNYFFAPKNFDLLAEYNKYFCLTDVFVANSTGVVTHRDHFVISFDYHILYQNIAEFRDLSISNTKISKQHNLSDTRDWKLDLKRQSLATNSSWEDFFTICLYRPFDLRYYYHHQDVVEYPRNEIMRNMIKTSNLALVVCRQQKSIGFQHCFVTDCIGEGNNISIHSRERSYHFPLYTYPDTENQQTNIFVEKEPNLSQNFLEVIQTKLGYQPTPEAIFYYAYAIFHSPTYRQRYAEFLKIDFPRLPLTANPDLFQALATEGEKLVNLHLLKSEQLQNLITRYEGQGENQVTEVRYNENQQRIYINKQQYFVGITQDIWQFKIGGYQVLEKWLKDRKKANRYLSPEEIIHYQKIVVALQETQYIMSHIDDIIPQFPIL
jgi:predicted helicase